MEIDTVTLIEQFFVKHISTCRVMTISEFPVQSKICVGEDGLYDRVIRYSVCCLGSQREKT